MTDEELVRAFESATLPADHFTHRAHVRVAWWYLTRYPIGESLTRFTTALKRFAARLDKAGLYHETVTIAYVLLIAERLGGSPAASWDDFSAAHPDLLTTRPSILERYYDEATLQSARARSGFVMPTRAREC
jgi:hypothetical protein